MLRAKQLRGSFIFLISLLIELWSTSLPPHCVNSSLFYILSMENVLQKFYNSRGLSSSPTLSIITLLFHQFLTIPSFDSQVVIFLKKGKCQKHLNRGLCRATDKIISPPPICCVGCVPPPKKFYASEVLNPLFPSLEKMCGVQIITVMTYCNKY